MKVLNQVLALVVASVISVSSFGEGKIAVVDPQGAMLATSAGQARSEKFAKSSEVVSTKAKLDGIGAEIKALEAAFQKSGQTWSADQKAENEKKYQSLSQDYEFNVKKIQKAQQEVMQQLVQELTPKYQAAVKQVIEAEKIGLLLNPEAVTLASPEFNITPKVVEIMNKLPDQAAPAAAPAKK